MILVGFGDSTNSGDRDEGLNVSKKVRNNIYSVIKKVTYIDR